MNRIIIITGTSKGIGRSLCEYYLSRDDIVVGCSRGEKSIKQKNYRHYCLDVTDEKAVVSMVGDVKKKHSRIDVLLNNAGIASMNHILTSPYRTARKIFDTNFMGTFNFLREVSKVMVRQKYGRIVNFTTVARPLRLEGEALYAASKAAVENLTEISARELSDFGITVNAVGPTPIETDLIKNVPEDKISALLERQAIKRFAVLEDITNVIDFLIDERSGFVTGQIIYLGGVNS